MLLAVIKKEFQGHLVSSRFLICAGILLVLAVLAAWVGTDDYLIRDGIYQDHLKSQQRALETIQVFSYLQPVHARAPEPLSVLDRGFEGRLDDQVRISIYEIPVGPREAHRGNEFLASSRSLDLTMLVRLVLGLLALLLTFDAVVGERANGNLKLVLAYGISRRRLLVGKFLGALLALSGPLVASVAMSVCILQIHGQVTLGAALWQRLAALVAGYLGYLSLMLLLGMLLSLSAHSSSAALVMSLLAWLLIVFLIPQSAVAIAAGSTEESCDPQTLMSRLKDLDSQRREDLGLATKEHQPVLWNKALSSPVMEMEERRVRMRFGSRSYYNARAAYYDTETALGMSYAEKIHSERQTCAKSMERAEQRARFLATLSPAFLLERLAEAFAATSVADYDAYFADCRAYRLQLIEYLARRGAFGSWRWFTDDPTPVPWTSFVGVPDPSEVGVEEVPELVTKYLSHEIQAQVRDMLDSYDRDPARNLHFDDLPRPARKTQSLAQAIRRVWVEILGLLLSGGLFLAWLLLSFERYELG